MLGITRPHFYFIPPIIHFITSPTVSPLDNFTSTFTQYVHLLGLASYVPGESRPSRSLVRPGLLFPWLEQFSSVPGEGRLPVSLVRVDLLGDRHTTRWGRGAGAPDLSRADLQTRKKMGTQIKVEDQKSSLFFVLLHREPGGMNTHSPML